MSGTLAKVRKIIDDKTITPTIVNPNSNFVVTTYWWGRGNLNLNTARPCVAFYEIFLQQIQKIHLRFQRHSSFHRLCPLVSL